MSDLDQKLQVFDRNAEAAVRILILWLEHDGDKLISMARGRHVEGHYRFRDRLMYEHSPDELTAEAAQELADAINYIARRTDLERDGGS